MQSVNSHLSWTLSLSLIANLTSLAICHLWHRAKGPWRSGRETHRRTSITAASDVVNPKLQIMMLSTSIGNTSSLFQRGLCHYTTYTLPSGELMWKWSEREGNQQGGNKHLGFQGLGKQRRSFSKDLTDVSRLFPKRWSCIFLTFY